MPSPDPARTGTPAKDALRQALEGPARRSRAEEGRGEEARREDGPACPLPRGRAAGVVEVASPAEILHFWQVLDGFAEFKPRVVLLASSDAWKAAEELGRRKASVILRPELVFAPFTRDRVNPAAELARTGPRSPSRLPTTGTNRSRAISSASRSCEARRGLLRNGPPLLAAAPAELLGADKRLGSLEKGSDADLLLFDADPLSAKAVLRRVYLGGREIYAEDVR